MTPKIEYRRPQLFGKQVETAWSIAHSLQSDIEYMLQEMNNKQASIPDHAWKILLKHIIRDLDDIKQHSRDNDEVEV